MTWAEAFCAAAIALIICVFAIGFIYFAKMPSASEKRWDACVVKGLPITECNKLLKSWERGE